MTPGEWEPYGLKSLQQISINDWRKLLLLVSPSSARPPPMDAGPTEELSEGTRELARILRELDRLFELRLIDEKLLKSAKRDALKQRLLRP